MVRVHVLALDKEINMTEDLSKIGDEELRAIISFKKNRLHELKRDKFLSSNCFNLSRKYGSLEAQRRRSEIRRYIEELDSRQK